MHSSKQTTNLQATQSYHAHFEVIQKKLQTLGDGQSAVVELHKHRSLGFEVLVCRLPDDTVDQQKVFYISFQTRHPSNNGLSHILEHLCMDATEQHPNEPRLMFKVMEGALQSSFYAAVQDEAVMYSVATADHKEFVNLARLFLNGVFSPSLTMEAFKQEGWHIEEKQGQNPTFNGVVYNEMKGRYGDPMSRLQSAVRAMLFGGSHLAFDTGGDPACIPTLSHRELLDFHKEHYHPSRARIVVYCDSKPETLKEVFDLIAQKVQSYGAADPLIATSQRSRRAAPIEETLAYPGVSNSTVAAVAWPIETPRNAEELCMWRLAERMLLGDESSPLRSGLVERKIANSVEQQGLRIASTESYFQILADIPQGVEAERFCHEVVKILREFCEQQLSSDDVKLITDQYRFALCESEVASFSRGFMKAYEVMPLWIGGADPVECTETLGAFTTVEEQILKEPKTLQDFIKNNLLNNIERVTVVLKPSKDEYNQAKVAEEKLVQEKMAEEKSSGVSFRLESSEAGSVKGSQFGAAAPLILLNPSELPQELPRKVQRELSNAAMPNMVLGAIASQDIAHAKMAFNVNALPDNIRPYAGLVSQVLLDEQIRRDVSKLAGSITVQVSRGGNSSRDTEQAALLVEGAAFLKDSERLFELMQKAVRGFAAPTEERCAQLVAETIRRLTGSADSLTACLEAKAAVSEKFAKTSSLTGYRQLCFLKQLHEKLGKGGWREVKNDLDQFGSLFTQDNLSAGWYSREDMLDTGSELLQGMLRQWPRSPHEFTPPRTPAFTKDDEVKGIEAPIGSVGLGFCLVLPSNKMEDLRGAMIVLMRFMSNEYLVTQTRGLGSAYEAGMQYDSELDVITGTISHSAASKMPANIELLRNFPSMAPTLVESLDKHRLERLIVGAISGFGLGAYPREASSFDFRRFYCEIPPEARDKLYQQTRDCTVDQLREAAQVLSESAHDIAIRVIGPGDALKGKGLTILSPYL